jgi:hypothetical protein
MMSATIRRRVASYGEQLSAAASELASFVSNAIMGSGEVFLSRPTAYRKLPAYAASECLPTIPSLLNRREASLEPMIRRSVR